MTRLGFLLLFVVFGLAIGWGIVRIIIELGEDAEQEREWERKWRHRR